MRRDGTSLGVQALFALALLGACIAAVVTLSWPGAFPLPAAAHDGNRLLDEARGWSVATLTFAAPTGILGLALLRRGERRGRLLVAGAAAYLVYTFLELAVSGPFTPLYLVYVVTYASALVVLVHAVWTEASAARVAPVEVAGRIVVTVYSALVGGGLALAWLAAIIGRSIAGSFGWLDPVASVGQVVQALDLGLQVPLFVSASVVVSRRRPAATMLAGVALTMGALMSTALSGMVIVRALGTRSSLVPAIPFVALALASVLLATWFFRRTA